MIYPIACWFAFNLAWIPLINAGLLWLLPPGGRALYAAAFALLWLAGNAGAVRALRPVVESPVLAGRGRRRIALALIVGASALVFLGRAYVNPLGNFDGIGFWNAKSLAIAESYLAGAPFRPSEPYWILSGYPLALPLSLSAVAILSGGWSPAIPIVFHLITLCVCQAFFAHWLLFRFARRADWRLGAASALVAFGPVMASHLTADFGLLFGLLLQSAIAVRLYDGSAKRFELLLAGLIAGWMWNLKNEGALLAVAGLALLALCAWRTGSVRKLWPVFTPLAAAVLLWLWFKAVAHEPAAMPGGAAAIFARALDPARYLEPLRALALFHVAVLAGLVLIWLFTLRRSWRAFWIFSPLLVVHGIYTAIFVVTSYDQAWHIGTAFARLQYTLFPSFALLASYVHARAADPDLTNGPG